MTRCFSLSLVAFCTLCYGSSIFFNGGATSSPPQTLLVLGASRFLTLLLAALLLYHASGRPAALALPLSRAALYPVLTVLLGNAGMLAFVALCALEARDGSPGLVSGMVSLYMVLPVAWGIALRSERASARKLCGVALSLAATLLLGLAPAADGAPGLLAGAGAPLRLALLLAACGCWGAMDIASASLARSGPPLQVALLSALGQAVTCALAALWVLGSGSSAAPGAPGAAAAAAANTARLALGNALGVIGWLAFCQLGGEPGSEVSSFAPLISLYVFLPVLVELVALGGALAPLQAGGMALAVAGALCIALDWGSGGGGGGGGGGAAGAAGAAAEAAAAAEARGAGAASPVAAASGLPLAGPAGGARQRGAGAGAGGGAAAVAAAPAPAPAAAAAAAAGLASQGEGGAVDAGAILVAGGGEEEGEAGEAAGERHPLSPRSQLAQARAV
jgi:drug/metabolite transporter (DMT)-like permease